MLGKRIEQKREEKGWTRYMLAKQSGVSQSYIRPLEEGSNSPSIDVLIKISKALETSIDELVYETEETYENIT
ncbi:helix-turn-helix transcriptional regulator [Mycolicibacterium fortuitum]|nr:helix-turn-helix transcriptional regulator [Mycolicibacterium fortuitum]MPY20661.1 helix-turn-helix transcriptional regulator [Paenibacillus glucanolyticus]